MARKYQSVTKDEFESKLEGHLSFTEVNPKGTSEVVYEGNLPSDRLVVRIYSTIERGRSRSKGSDAIRTVIFDKQLGKPVGGETKTLRLAPSPSNREGWFGNFLPKLRSLYRNWRHWSKTCPECNSVMAVREGQYGKFWGCTSYPQCENIESYNEVDGI